MIQLALPTMKIEVIVPSERKYSIWIEGQTFHSFKLKQISWMNDNYAFGWLKCHLSSHWLFDWMSQWMDWWKFTSNLLTDSEIFKDHGICSMLLLFSWWHFVSSNISTNHWIQSISSLIDKRNSTDENNDKESIKIA